MHPYLLEGFFLSFQLILEILCSIPQSNLIGCILTWRVRGIFCILYLIRKFLQFGILPTWSCHHDDALSGQRNKCREVLSLQLQLPPPFHQTFRREGAGRPAVTPRSSNISRLDEWQGHESWLRRCIPCVQRQFASKLKITISDEQSICIPAADGWQQARP